MIRVKAQAAGNGRSLSKACNAGSDHLGGSLRAGREALVRVVAPLDKGVAIARFYEQQHPKEGSDATASEASSSDHHVPENDWYIWGMDWENDKDEAVKLGEDMRAKGLAIANYYRAKYDPTFVDDNEVDNQFPAWGQDPEADKAHGKAIGEYWATRGKQIGEEQKERWANPAGEETTAKDEEGSADGPPWKDPGKDTGKFWEDFYRSMFDPTYDADKDLNW